MGWFSKKKDLNDQKVNGNCNVVLNIEREKGFQKLIFSKPGTSEYRINYVLSGNNVFISGDLGEAVYSLTCAATLENIKGFNLSYFTGKLSAFCESRWDFDSKLAKKQLNEYWEENEMKNYEDEREMHKMILHAINESNSLESYQAMLYPVYHNTSIESDDFEVIYDFGKEMPMRLIGYWVGLQLAIEQLEAKEEKTA